MRLKGSEEGAGAATFVALAAGTAACSAAASASSFASRSRRGARGALCRELRFARGSRQEQAPTDFSQVHASPGVRRLARELGRRSQQGQRHRRKEPHHQGRRARLSARSGPRRRRRLAPAAPAGGAGIPEIPAQDFSKFGPIETKPLSRIKKLSGPLLHRAWLNIPHVTQNDEADITELEAYRKELDTAAKEKGYRVTMLAFLIKASVAGLKQFPEFNSSLSPEKDALILKRYYHLGIAVDTPDGLVVPVIKDVGPQGHHRDSARRWARSRRRRATASSAPSDMQGGSFTISSLGGIGGTASRRS